MRYVSTYKGQKLGEGNLASDLRFDAGQSRERMGFNFAPRSSTQADRSMKAEQRATNCKPKLYRVT